MWDLTEWRVVRSSSFLDFFAAAWWSAGGGGLVFGSMWMGTFALKMKFVLMGGLSVERKEKGKVVG